MTITPKRLSRSIDSADQTNITNEPQKTTFRRRRTRRTSAETELLASQPEQTSPEPTPIFLVPQHLCLSDGINQIRSELHVERISPDFDSDYWHFVQLFD